MKESVGSPLCIWLLQSLSADSLARNTVPVPVETGEAALGQVEAGFGATRHLATNGLTLTGEAT
jgi:hypothetical protein